MTLRRFLGDEPKPGEPEFDSTERNMWRALDQYNAKLCPGCGQPHTKSLFDATAETRPRYTAGFVQCLGCKELLTQQDAQRIKDGKNQRQRQQGMKHPEDAPAIITGHRYWSTWEQPELTEESTP